MLRVNQAEELSQTTDSNKIHNPSQTQQKAEKTLLATIVEGST